MPSQRGSAEEHRGEGGWISSSAPAIACATQRLYPLRPQPVAHTSRRHGGVLPLLRSLSIFNSVSLCRRLPRPGRGGKCHVPSSLPPLSRSQKSQLLCNQANPASFCKTPGVGVPLHRLPFGISNIQPLFLCPVATVATGISPGVEGFLKLSTDRCQLSTVFHPRSRTRI
jgi:hypothetical protein